MNPVAAPGTELRGLHPSAPRALPFAPDLHVRSFGLQRERGSLQVYSAEPSGLRQITRAYLGHWHEAIFAPPVPVVPFLVHEADRGPAAERTSVRASFSRRHALDEDFEVIPIPGHTPGASAFLWDSGEYRMLFTGDSIYLDHGEWVAAVLDSSDRDAYLESLELLRELDFDVLVPWAASAGEPFHSLTTPAEARARIDAIIERLRRGEDR